MKIVECSSFTVELGNVLLELVFLGLNG